MEITAEHATKIIALCDVGLSYGLGKPIPGQMCVEAAVCFGLGLPHNDDPKCVSPVIRALKISLNDSTWSSNEARGKGLCRLAVAQLGSKDVFDDVEFIKRVSKLVIKVYVPIALRAAAIMQTDGIHKSALLYAAVVCENDGSESSAYAANAAANAANATDAAANAAARATAYAAYAAARATAYATDAANAAAYAAAYAADAAYAAAADNRDKILSEFSEHVVQILLDMKAPGCQWLYLTS